MQQPPNPYSQYPQQQWQYPQPMTPQPRFYSAPVMVTPVSPANQSMKTAAIILFITSFVCALIGVPTTVILIGIPILIIGFICHIIAFVCLCLI
jgi:hypothetical protein